MQTNPYYVFSQWVRRQKMIRRFLQPSLPKFTIFQRRPRTNRYPKALAPSAVPTSQTTMLFQPSEPRTSIQDHALGEFQFGTVDAELISTPSTSSAESAVVPLPAPLSPMNVPPAHTVEASVDARKNVQRHPAWETGYWLQQGDTQDDARLVGAPMETSTRGSSLLPDVRRETLAPRFGSGATVETSAIPSVPSHQNLLSGHVAANVGPSDATGPFATPRSGPSELRGPTRWLPGDILIARFATHDLVERGGVRLAVLRDVTHVEGPTERPAGNTLAPLSIRPAWTDTLLRNMLAFGRIVVSILIQLPRNSWNPFMGRC